MKNLRTIQIGTMIKKKKILISSLMRKTRASLILTRRINLQKSNWRKQPQTYTPRMSQSLTSKNTKLHKIVMKVNQKKKSLAMRMIKTSIN